MQKVWQGTKGKLERRDVGRSENLGVEAKNLGDESSSMDGAKIWPPPLLPLASDIPGEKQKIDLERAISYFCMPFHFHLTFFGKNFPDVVYDYILPKGKEENYEISQSIVGSACYLSQNLPKIGHVLLKIKGTYLICNVAYMALYLKYLVTIIHILNASAYIQPWFYINVSSIVEF